jgi:hypothetical protein
LGKRELVSPLRELAFYPPGLAAVGGRAGEVSIHPPMSSAEDGYCSADSPRAESGDEQLAAAEESPRAGFGHNKRERDVPSPSSPLPAAKRRYELCLPLSGKTRSFS